MFITNEARSTDNSSSVGLISSKSANCTAESIDEDVRQTPLIVIVGTALPVGTVSELVLIWWFIRKQNKKPRDNLFIVEQAWKRRDGYHCVPHPYLRLLALFVVFVIAPAILKANLSQVIPPPRYVCC